VTGATSVQQARASTPPLNQALVHLNAESAAEAEACCAAAGQSGRHQHNAAVDADSDSAPAAAMAEPACKRDGERAAHLRHLCEPGSAEVCDSEGLADPATTGAAQAGASPVAHADRPAHLPPAISKLIGPAKVRFATPSRLPCATSMAARTAKRCVLPGVSMALPGRPQHKPCGERIAAHLHLRSPPCASTLCLVTQSLPGVCRSASWSRPRSASSCCSNALCSSRAATRLPISSSARSTPSSQRLVDLPPARSRQLLGFCHVYVCS
jgi:hypothetical protein